MEGNPAKRQRTMFDTFTPSEKLDLTGEVVKIKVGKEPDVKIFTVHETVLKNGSSAMLRTALKLKSEWAERRGDSEPVNLENYNLKAFEIYVRWLYSGDIVVYEPQYTTFVRAYVLGEEILDREFQNAVMISLVDCNAIYDWKPFETSIDMAYRKLPENSPIRRLIVDLWASTSEPSMVKECFNRHYNHQFLIDVIIAMKEMRSTKERRKINIKPGNIDEYLHQDLGVEGLEKEKSGRRQD